MKMVKCHKLLRRFVLRASMLVLAVTVVSLMKLAPDEVNNLVEPSVSDLDKCALRFGSNVNQEVVLQKPSGSLLLVPFGLVRRESEENLTKAVFGGLLETNSLRPNARVLCVGGGSASVVSSMREMGVLDAVSVESHPFFSLFKRRFVYELAFEDNAFDLVFSADIDRVSVPSLLAMEIERVLSPGGTGVVFVRSRKFYSSGLISSFLKGSDVVHACGSGSFTVVIFKKRLNSFTSFENFRLPSDCPSVTKNKPFMKFLEPLSDKSAPSYLPKHMNISSRNKLVYINIGAGEFAKRNVIEMKNPYCSNHHKGFDVYVIDYKTSVLTSYITEPGITFIYDPSLSGTPLAPEISPDDYLVDVMEEEEFEFVPWFTKTVTNGDFVVLVMNAKLAELNVLTQLFRTGAICHVDELFIRCSDAAADCNSLLESLRKSGVYAHEWLGD